MAAHGLRQPQRENSSCTLKGAPVSTVMPLFLAAVISLLHSTRVAST
jgi:hypothetical protein